MRATARRDIGSFLSNDPPSPAPAPRLPRVTLSGQVRSVLRADPLRWFSNAEIAAATGLTIGEVNGATNSLVQLGEADRSLPPERARRKAGQTFRWRS